MSSWQACIFSHSLFLPNSVLTSHSLGSSLFPEVKAKRSNELLVVLNNISSKIEWGKMVGGLTTVFPFTDDLVPHVPGRSCGRSVFPWAWNQGWVRPARPWEWLLLKCRVPGALATPETQVCMELWQPRFWSHFCCRQPRDLTKE